MAEFENGNCTQCGFDPSIDESPPIEYEKEGNYACPYCEFGIIKVKRKRDDLIEEGGIDARTSE